MSDLLWTSAEIVAATGGRPVGALPSGVTGVSIDTRSLEAGDAFFAIKGEQFDGHGFLRQALAAGAGLLIVAEHKLPALGSIAAPMIVVDDVLAALVKLADAARRRSQARIVAVTGSVGKTTTKDALRHVLGAQGSVHASAASFNNHWGVPLTLARLPADTRFAVFEIGMNHPNEIRPLVKLVRPHVAVVTLIAPAHLGFFRDLEEIATAKGEIFEGVVAGGAAIVNADDPLTSSVLVPLAAAAGVTRITRFGESPKADFVLTGFEPLGEGSHVTARIDGTDVDFRLPSSGRHLVQNVLAVLGACDLLGADVTQAAEALSSWRASKGRGERHDLCLSDTCRITLLDESYNANPTSMRAAFSLLAGVRPMAGGRRIAVIGDMLELGEFSSGLHADLAEPLLASGATLAILVGPEMEALAEALGDRMEWEWHPKAGEVRESLLQYLRDGDVVVIKASKGIGFAKLVDELLKASMPQRVEGRAPTHNDLRQEG